MHSNKFIYKASLFKKRIIFIGLITFIGAQTSFKADSAAAPLISIDGSSTVYPITEAVAEEFGIKNRSTRVTVGISGTGGGLKKFCRGEVDISDASRPIKTKEIKLCEKNGIKFIELPVAYDGLAVVINKKNSWANTMTVAELNKLWQPAAKKNITRWNQIRTGWPNKEIALFGPGVDSGTFDYFTETVVGKTQASRGDFTSSEDDNVIVQGVSRNLYALGYFGLAYYEENKNRLNVVGIDNGSGPIIPSQKTVKDGSYSPLSRPLFIYVSTGSLARPEVTKFIEFFLSEGPALAQEVGYVPLPEDIRKKVKEIYEKKIIGSFYKGKATKKKSLKDILNR